MPTYDYRCGKCGHEFDRFQPITAKPLRKCPACGANKLQRLIGTGAAVLFKGSGFYETDYRSDSYQKAAKAEKDEASGKTDKSDGDKGSKKKDASKKTDATSKKTDSGTSKKKSDNNS